MRPPPAALDAARELASREGGLVTYRADGTAHASVVNAAVVDHPTSGEPVVGFVVQGGRRKKLAHLRARPSALVVFRSGWDWIAVEGDVDLVGPDDQDLIARPGAAHLFRAIYAASIGGSPSDWTTTDSAAEVERHAAVLVRPTRVYGSPAHD